VTIDAFDQLSEGCKDSLVGIANVNVISADGDQTKFATITKKAILENPDFLVTVGSQLTNTALGSEFSKNLPTVIATAITDPNLVAGLKAIGVEPPRQKAVAIISDRPIVDIFAQLSKVAMELKPGLRKVGILCNQGEINSMATAEGIASAMAADSILTKFGYLTSPDDVSKVTQALLLDKVELIVIPHDKYAVEKAATIAQICGSLGIPVLSLDDGTVRKSGVTAAVSVNYRIIGQEVARIVKSIIFDKYSAEKIPVVQYQRASIYINQVTAAKLGINIGGGLLRDAVILK